MPVRINLKELFAADVQTIFTDKINYNFNKMLELGVGEIGERGITGPGGSAGPGGIPGPDGQRGNKWFVGTGDPNGQSFTGLIDGDFYLDTSTSSIWQYSDISPGAWTLVADISAIVINFLESLGSPFVRGAGDASPLDDRFIVFQHRSNNDFERLADIQLGASFAGNSSDNDMLLLNNWNEHLNSGGLGLSNFPADVSELFNSLNFISIDHTLNTQGRYHMEMGSLYQSNSAASNVISSLTHNLKIKYLMDTAAGPSYPISNIDGVIISSFSLTNPPSESVTTIDKNAIFEFWTPKFNDEGAGTIQENIKFAMGAQEGLAYFFPTLIPMDGFVIQHFGTSALEIGINGIPSDSLSNLPVVFDDVPMAIIDGTDDTSLFINKEIIQTGGDIQNVPTTPVEFLRKDVAGTWTFNITDKQRIFSNGENIFMTQSQWVATAAAYTEPGRLTIYETSTPTNPKKIHEITTNSITTYNFALPLPPSYDDHGHIENGPYSPDEIPLSGVMDVTFAGKYGYLVRSLATPPAGPNDIFAHQFEIFEMDSRGSQLHMIASLNHATMIYAKRVKLNGQYAFVMSAEMAAAGTATTNNLTSLLLCEPFVDPIGQPDYTIKGLGSANLPKANYISNTNLSPVLEDWVDFDIYNDKAYVLKRTHIGLDDKLHLSTYSIADPSNIFSLSSGPPTIAEWTGVHHQHPGAVKVDSQHAYVVCGESNNISVGGNFAILSLSEEQHLGPPLVVSSTMEFEPYLIDIEISGDYAYVLARMTATGRATIIIIDITDKAAPFLVAMDNTGLTECVNPSSMTLRGKNIYVAAAGATPGSADQGMYIFNIDGIKSSSANIGNIASNEIKVSGKVSTGQNLDVGANAAVGQNLTVHGDICVGGKINVDQYSFGMVPIGTVVPWVGNWSSFPFTSPPDGWLVCDGSVISSSTYPELYELLGGLAGPHPFGGPGVLPNMTSPHGKVIAGAGGASGAQGNDIGLPTKTLGFNDLPVHTHDLTGVTASLSGSTGINSVSHTHSYEATRANNGTGHHESGNAAFEWRLGENDTSGPNNPSHTHDLSTGSATLSGNTGNNTTTGNSFSLYQPTLVINHIIYAGESI